MNHSVPIPVWEKANLTLNEASEYFNIGVNKLREVTNREECEDYVLLVGNKRLIKREPFNSYLSKIYKI